MRRHYYYGCRGTESGHYLHGDNKTAHAKELDGGFPVAMLDGTFAPLDRNDVRWKITQLRNGHVVSILVRHDNTIDTRPGSNAAFVVVDACAWDPASILEDARHRFTDCWERLHDARISNAP